MPHCYSCKTTENLGNPYHRTATGNYYICRDCNGKKLKAYFDRCKRLVFDHYGWRCACCSETMPQFLTIDHINNDGKDHRFPSGNKVTGRNLYSQIIKAGFPDTYQTLCMNCNFGKSRNGGICPHKIV